MNKVLYIYMHSYVKTSKTYFFMDTRNQNKKKITALMVLTVQR